MEIENNNNNIENNKIMTTRFEVKKWNPVIMWSWNL